MVTNQLGILVMTLAIASAVAVTTNANAQVIEKDDPSSVSIGGNVTTLDDIDLTIDFNDKTPLPPNGTLTIQTEGINDIDFQSLVPAGMSVILDNQTATVTSHPVEVVTDTSSDDGSSNGNDDEEEN